MGILKGHPKVFSDIDDAVAWYEARQPGVGRRFTDEIDKMYPKIQAHPTAWPPIRKGVRHLAVKKFPFHVVYAIRADAIWVVAVAHDSWRPNFWTKRLTDIPSN